MTGSTGSDGGSGMEAGTGGADGGRGIVGCNVREGGGGTQQPLQSEVQDSEQRDGQYNSSSEEPRRGAKYEGAREEAESC